jgi:hypothetical protein
MRLVATTTCLTVLGGILFAQLPPNQQNFRVRATRIDGPIELTGRLSDPRWNLAPPIDIAYEVTPGENIPARQRTIAKILYNDDYIYVGFLCYDTDIKQLRARVTDRDRIFDDDFVIVMFDTYAENQRAFNFFVNPHGIQADLLRSGNNEDSRWDAIWESAAFIGDSLWSAEMAIPFRSLRFPEQEEQSWVMFIGRNYPRSSRIIFSWTPFDRNNPCFLCQGGMLEGLRGIRTSTAVEVLPYIVGLQSGALNNRNNPAAGFTNGDIRGRVGAGFKVAPSSDLTIEGVVNPDFSQVESDATQIDVNTTFALFYPERRPFFQEGADLFDTRIDGFYSRMINNPLGAAKLIHKSGSWSAAYLAASDRNTSFIVPGEESSSFVNSDLRSFSNITRVRYDAGNESFLGGLVTTRNLSGGHNYVGGVDWNYLFSGNYYFRGQLLASRTRELNNLSLFSGSRPFRNTSFNAAFNGETYTGTAVEADISYRSREYNASLEYADFSPTFQAHNGFVTGNDARKVSFNQTYNWYPNGKVVDVGFVFFDAGLRFNYSGIRKRRWILLGSGLNMKAQTSVNVGFLLNNERFRGVEFTNLPNMFFNFNTRPIGEVSVFVNGDIGRYIFRSGTPRAGKGHNLRLTTTLRPTDKLQVDLSYRRSQLHSVQTGELFFDGYIARAVGIYQFSPEFFVRLISEYNKFSKSFQLYPLISYKLNPFTIFYAGSTHNLHNFDDPYGIQQTERQFFVKLQYLWRN